MVKLAAVVEAKRPAIEAACQHNGVRALWVFGSATSPGFRADQSDVDFLVQLADDQPPARQFFGLYRSLAEIFDERIDLVSLAGIKNPLFRRELERTRIPVYAVSPRTQPLP